MYRYKPKYNIGGRILKRLQEGGPIKRTSVQYGTPEYKKAYEEGRVATNFDPSSMTYDLQDLPEFTVTGKDERVKDSMSKAGSKFWNVASDLLSEPQRKMVEGLTGTYQYPSEAMGIENPVGAFAVDALADPMNLLGAGLIDDLTKGGLRGMLKSKAGDVGRNFSKDKVYRNFLKGNTSTLDKTLLSTVYNKPIKKHMDEGFEKLKSTAKKRNEEYNKVQKKLNYTDTAHKRFNQLYKDKILQNHPDKLNYDAIRDHPTYFSFLDEKGLLDNTLTSSENLKGAMDNKQLVDEFWGSFKKSQRGVAVEDQSVIKDAMIFGDTGVWGRGNYSSNSDLILHKFSTPRGGRKGYQGQLELNLPDVESASGIDKLNLIKNKFASSLNKDFDSKVDREGVIGLISEYGGQSSAERVIKREVLDKQPDILKLSDVVENLGEVDEDVLKKVGAYGLKEAGGTGKHFSYNTSIISGPKSKLSETYKKAISELPDDKRKKFYAFRDKMETEFNVLEEKANYIRSKKYQSADDFTKLDQYERDLSKLKRTFDEAAKKAITNTSITGIGGLTASLAYNIVDEFSDNHAEKNLKKWNEYNEFLKSPENSEIKGKLDSLDREVQKFESSELMTNGGVDKKRHIYRSFMKDKEYKKIVRRKVNSPDELVKRNIDTTTKQLELLKQMGYVIDDDSRYQKKLTNVPDMKKGGKLKYSQGGDLLRMLMEGDPSSIGGDMGFGMGSPLQMAGSIGASFIPTKSVGGKAAAGALQGASSGLAFGPIGAGIGAGVGGLTGLISGMSQQKQENEIKNRRRETEDRQFNIASRAILSNYPTQGVATSGFYKNGGMVGSDIDNVMMTGGYMKPMAEGVSSAHGKSHNDGGINLYEGMDNFAEIEDGETVNRDKVYSDTLRVPDFAMKALGMYKKKRR